MRRVLVFILLIVLLPLEVLAQGNSFSPQGSQRIAVPYQPAGSERARPVDARIQTAGAQSFSSAGAQPRDFSTPKSQPMSNCFPGTIGCIDFR